MSTLVRTWTCSLNNVPASEANVQAQARGILRAYVTAIKAAGWSVRGSSNGVAAVMDGADRWAADADLVWHSAGTAHSWIVFTKADYPTTGKSIDILLALSTGPTNQHQINISFASMAYSGGSTTADPTAATSTKNRSLSAKSIVSSVLTGCRYHICRNTSGDVLLMVSHNSTGRIHHGTLIASTTGQRGAPYEDPYPFYAYSGFDSGGKGALTHGNMSIPGNCVGFNAHDDLANAHTALAALTYATGLVHAQIPSTGDAHSSQLPMFPAIIWSGLPLYELRGQLVDIRIAPSGSGVAQGTEEPASPATTTCGLFGELWAPNGGTTIVL